MSSSFGFGRIKKSAPYSIGEEKAKIKKLFYAAQRRAKLLILGDRGVEKSR
jgi:hypothetical protein